MFLYIFFNDELDFCTLPSSHSILNTNSQSFGRKSQKCKIESNNPKCYTDKCLINIVLYITISMGNLHYKKWKEIPFVIQFIKQTFHPLY